MKKDKLHEILNPYKDLHPRQLFAFLSAATETLYGGAAGGGKSHFLRYLAIWCAFHCPGIQIYLFRRTYPDLQKNHMEGPTSFPTLLAPFEYDNLFSRQWGKVFINYGKGVINFENGSRIFLCHCQHEKHKTNYQGAEIHLLLIDELTHFTETIYTYLRARCRLGAWKARLIDGTDMRGTFPKILNGSNPGGIGHNWVKTMFVDFQAEEAISRTPKTEGGMLRQYVPARIDDNPTLLENDPEYIDRLEGLGDPALVKAMKEGDWDIVSGGALDDVWNKKVHIIRPFDIPRNWHVDRSFDWGSTAPFSVGWWAESTGEEVRMPDGSKKAWPKGTLFRIAEWYGWNGKPNQGCKMLSTDIAEGILKMEKEHHALKNLRVKPGPADNSIFDVVDGKSISKGMRKAGVRWTRSDKSPGSRINGLEEVRERLKASTKHPMEKPGLFAFDTCVHFARTIPTLPRDENKPDDVDTKSEDHLYDDVRYRVTAPKRGTTVQEV